ncbi:laccase [Streptomyces alkaliphilus]|uniref:Laccase n=1 Tax=Streptomyces alkaliphilus TaxID=1472722 RepID=A0A7W3XZW6_9ACTN|nr:polyphenol oxidase family protein [Streptomyces alkaliphilus]MBB0242590.1 laccase [Streptomyces alkaliphilus]
MTGAAPVPGVRTADGVWRENTAFTDRWGVTGAAPRFAPGPADPREFEAAVGFTMSPLPGRDPGFAIRNREWAAGDLGIAPDAPIWMHQVHGARVAVADGPWPGPPPEVDGVVTARPGAVLAVLTADCVPVLLSDPVAGVAGAAHAGRPGLIAGVVPATVAAMVELGAEPSRLVARTGPAVCGRCYEVPSAMRADAERAAPGCGAVTAVGTPAIDIPAGVRRQLLDVGVRDVRLSPVCTLESADHFSYRREGVTGRLASFVRCSGGNSAVGPVGDSTGGVRLPPRPR